MNKILVVERDSMLLSLVAEILNLYGFHALTTTLPEQAYELTILEKPQLILCGHSSINLNSYETCWTFLQKIRQNVETANIPFILMTGDDLETIPNWQNYLKYEDILLKPFNTQVFMEKINTYFSLSQPKSNTEKSYKSPENNGHCNRNGFFTLQNPTTHHCSYILA